ncbi:MAG: TIGR04211 family SH3 domain-containing protein [Gammaproteobacteria bacterium]
MSLLLIMFSANAQTETVYVIDQLLVGVHAEKNLDSAITKVLPTGTMLEILERDGELARVKDQQGGEGWIDSAYLMQNPPARQLVERLERANQELQKQLSKANAGGGTPNVGNSAGDSERAAEVDQLTKENTELKRKLSTEMVNNTKLLDKLNSAEALLADRPLSPAETQITELEKSVTDLKRRLEKSMQANKALKAENRRPLSQKLPSVDLEGFTWPLALAGFNIVLLAYGGGIYTMDYLNRRRHGGFRV